MPWIHTHPHTHTLCHISHVFHDFLAANAVASVLSHSAQTRKDARPPMMTAMMVMVIEWVLLAYPGIRQLSSTESLLALKRKAIASATDGEQQPPQAIAGRGLRNSIEHFTSVQQ